MRDTEFSILVFVIGFWSRYIHRLLGALDILAGGTVSVSIMIHHVSCAALFERVTLAGGTVSVVVFAPYFALACLYCSHRSKSNSEAELCWLETHFLGIVCCWIGEYGNVSESEGILDTRCFNFWRPFSIFLSELSWRWLTKALPTASSRKNQKSQ